MKVSEAEKLVCPFMSTHVAEYGATKCITTKCMAWETTKTHEQIKNTEEHNNGVKNVCMTQYRDGNKLSPQDCEGFCQRLR